MPTYQAKILREHAGRMLAQATSIVVFYGITGFLAGMLLFLLAPKMLSNVKSGFLWGAVAWAISLIAGISIGRKRAFTLRVQAQTVLCQVQIEENTRQGKEVKSTPDSVPTPTAPGPCS